MTHGSPPPVENADYRLMVESISDYAIFLLDPHGHVRSWNVGAQKLKGYRPEEIIGRSFEVFYPQQMIDIGFPARELSEAVRLGRFEDEDWRIRKDGSRFWASVVITALFDESGRHRGFAKVARDLTARRRHEEMLRRSEERFRLIVEGVRDYAIFMLDPDGYVASWNLGAQINKGYTAEEIIGQHFSVFYPQEKIDEGWPVQELEYALRDGRFEDEGWRIRKDGSRFWASVVITSLYDGHGRHYGFAKVTRDLTDRCRIDTLETQERYLYQFLALLGHELRNPLAPIANAVSIMRLEESVSEPMRRTRDILARQVAHLGRLVDDLLDVGRIVTGKVHLERQPVEMQQVVAESVEAMSSTLQARSHGLEVEVPREPLVVMGDRVRLVQVLNNLLHNAAKFTPDGGRVSVTLVPRGDRVELSVADNGPGIAPEELAYVFKLFAQSEKSTVGHHGGLGIGLSMVHQMVQRHGGEVSAFSSGEPGKGVEFVVRLPLIQRDG
ncbi:PAS domain-containing sensor histidine kinase [Lysobacter erysipheiresistens]|uniref:histidine kinase n=1 Tax=Novilysobacter erysipheiresistens TaxID=1749332 RepID=A0ABU7YWT7_9GAMM